MAAKTRPAAPARRRPKNVVAAARRGRPAREPAFSRESLRSWLGAILVFIVVHTFLLQAFRIPSGSMEPTLLIGDFLFVFPAYSVTVPLTDIRFFGYTDPRRGTVAVYQSPDARDGHPVVVKRLVGVPGDTLYMRAGLLYVNGIAQHQGFGAAAEPSGADETHPDFEWQKRVGLPRSRFGAAPAQPTHDNWGPFVVPPRHYFSLGDNRYNSKDARYYGFVPRENVRGRPLFIYLSIDFDAWRIRWDRIGQRIH